MTHPDHGLRITLYPMVHIGSPAFYAALTEDLRRFQVFLLEGVSLRGLRGPLYDLVARNLGLVTQQDHLEVPREGERVRLDMSDDDFTRHARMMPVRSYLLLLLVRPVLWGITLTATGRDASWSVFARARTPADPGEEAPFERLILTKRDRAMSDVLRAFAKDPWRIREARPAAVIAGAAHMPALCATLRDCGYRKGRVRWFEVLDGLEIPAKGGDGRARASRREVPAGRAASGGGHT